MDRDNPSLDILPASPEDLVEIIKIETASFSSPFSQGLFENELRLEMAHLYVAKQKGKIVGYMDFWQVGPEAHLINIAVHPDSRRLGVGRSLMDFLIEYTRRHRVREIFLDVRASNQGAIALYERYSFQKVGLRPRYYKDNDEDAVVMSLKL